MYVKLLNETTFQSGLKDGNEAKYNVSPLIQIYNHGFKKHDIALIESIISENEAVIIDRWKEYFNQK